MLLPKCITRPCFNVDEKTIIIVVNNILASRVMSGPMASTINFIGVKSSADVFGGSKLISLDTFFTLTSAKVSVWSERFLQVGGNGLQSRTDLHRDRLQCVYEKHWEPVTEQIRADQSRSEQIGFPLSCVRRRKFVALKEFLRYASHRFLVAASVTGSF